MKYHVLVGERSFEVEVDGEVVRVGGEAHRAVLTGIPATPMRHLLLDGASAVFAIEAAGQGTWMIQEEGERVEVEVIDERTRHVRSLVGPGKRAGGAGVLKAPMPGLVVRVLAQSGDRVVPGQGVVVLEAMKMENELKATHPGVVEAVLVQAGQVVEKGAPLVRMVASP